MLPDLEETLLIEVADDLDEAALEACLKPAAEILRRGGTVAFPTETVYGLGADALSESAIRLIYEAKGRPSDNPLIVHIAEASALSALTENISALAQKLMAAFWPGPLTLIFNKTSNVPHAVTGGLDTVAVRMPSHPVARTLIRLSGKPIAAPSANLSGRPSPTSAAHVVRDLKGRVNCIVSGTVSEVGLESTVVDLTGGVPVILRPGAITREMISEIAGACDVDRALTSPDSGAVPKAPGMKYKHYAPEADVTVLVGDNMAILKRFEVEIEQAVSLGQRLGLLLFDEDLVVLKLMLQDRFEADMLERHVIFFNQGSVKTPEIFASQLFRDLRASDDHGCKVVLVHGLEAVGLGDAIMNRLTKAAEGKVMRI